MGIDVKTNICPYCGGKINKNSSVCLCCQMNLSNVSRSEDNEPVKICPSCSRKYSFNTKVCSFCSRYLDQKISKIEKQQEGLNSVCMIINALTIPGLGSLIGGKKSEALSYMLCYFIWVVLVALIILHITNLFWILVIPAEFIVRSLNILPFFNFNNLE